ncbi:MAG TPA: Mur ligase domain-containing protein [Drouetiella sp.]
MAAQFSAEEIMDITEARLAVGLMPDAVGEVHTDTRTMPEGSWFVALPGRKYDGHDFLGDAFSEGAIGCIVGERTGYAIASTSFPLLAVTDPLEAVTKLARNWRRRIGTKVIVVMVNRSEERCPIGKSCYDELQVRKRTHFLRLANESIDAVLDAVLSVDEITEVLIAELSPTNLEHIQSALSALQPNVFVVAKDGYDHFRMSSSQQECAEGMRATFASLDKAKCKVILATNAQDLIIRSDDFDGAKFVLEEESPEDADAWASRVACEQIG